MLHQFEYLSPASEEELLKIISVHKEKARLLAGGTNLFVDIRSEFEKPEYVVDLKKIPGLNELSFSEEKGLFIGATVTCNEILECEAVKNKYPLLTMAAHELASYQIRNRATVVGNICYGSPAADMAPALLVLDAKVIITGMKGEKVLPLKEFFKGVKKTGLSRDEFVKGIQIPSKYSFMKGIYEKSKRIKGHDLSIVGVAMGKTADLFRVAIGACAPVPVLLKDFSAGTDVNDIIKEAMDNICPIDDLRGSGEYRKNMVCVYIKRLYEKIQGGN